MHVSMTLPTMAGHLDRSTLLAWCRAIDDGPYHSLAVGERIAFPNLEAHTALSFAAAATERVRIVPTIVVLPAHAELHMAKKLATLDVVCDGRLTVGVGVGGREEDFLAMGGRPYTGRHPRLDAQVATMRAVWAGEVPDGLAEPIGPPPVQAGGPPLLSGSLGPKSVARAAAWAMGVDGFSLDPIGEDWDATFGGVRSAWATGGATDEPYLATSFWYSLAPDGAAVLGAYARRYLGVFGAAVADMMASLTTAADVTTTLEALDRLAAAGCDEVFLVPTTTDVAELHELSGHLDGRYR